MCSSDLGIAGPYHTSKLLEAAHYLTAVAKFIVIPAVQHAADRKSVV